VRPDRDLFGQADQEISAFDSAFELVEHEQEEAGKNKRVYWKEIIEREEEKQAVEERQREQDREVAREKGEKGEGEDREVKEGSAQNPIKDFTAMINNRKKDLVGEATDQMQKLILKQV